MKKFLADIFRSCRSHDVLNLSANISFFAILSLLPLTMIFFSVLGLFLESNDSVTHIANVFAEVVPGAKELIASNITNILDKSSSMGFFGIAFLFLVSLVLFGSLERAFNRIFQSERKRNFFHSRLLAVIVIFLILLFLFLPSTLNLLELSLEEYGYTISLTRYLTAKVFFIVFAILSYIVTVVIVPNKKVYVRYAVVGAILYAVGIAAAKYIFHWYLLATFDRYNLIYGSLTAMILTAIWIYYLVNILLISTEVVANLQKRGKHDSRKR